MSKSEVLDVGDGRLTRDVHPGQELICGECHYRANVSPDPRISGAARVWWIPYSISSAAHLVAAAVALFTPGPARR
ncbi:MAG: hypothetical protein P8164_03010 [Gammaproteobacteria bacterium]